MEFLFDHYRKIKDPTLYLHNPDMKPISAIKARNRNFVLRFNDLSELTFEAPKYEKSKDGTMFELPYYSRLATKRLIKIDEIGWFQITQAVENEDGLTAYMSITAQSHQCAFKEKGFFCEGRLYKFYDESDPYDANYDSDKEDAIPSVVGQLYQQLGIKVAVAVTDFELDEDYGDWTIVYIDPLLRYVEGATSNICRAFKENSATYGYDFMVNSVENAFEVIFDFDFMHHAIKIKRVESVTQKTNIYLSFDNVVNELQTTEKADDIVTVLNCSGTDLDIRTVNPTGTNYIVDFSYYMDEVNYHWMSKELIAKIKSWKNLVNGKKEQHFSLVSSLRSAYEAHTVASSDIAYVKKKNQDLESVRDQYIVDSTTANMLFVAETVEIGKKSYDANSPYYTTTLSETDVMTCYAEPPTLSDGSFSFMGEGFSSTLKSNMENNKLYYMDYSGNTYCKIMIGTRMVGGSEVQYVKGIERYTVYSAVSGWITVYAGLVSSKQTVIDEYEDAANAILAQMQEIADEVNILKYLSSTPDLLTELRHYWIEGDYNNENLSILDSTKPEEAIDLAKELYSCGEKELARVCQPRFSVAVNSIKFIKIYAFRKFMYELALGKVITIEKKKGIYYYPALTQMSFSLENDDDSFELVFSNALKLTDWGFTYADLLASASRTSKNVISNWNELMDYSAHKNSIQELLLNPLDKSLRLAERNMNNQEFVVDNTGILGRKRKSEDLFESEQIRMINNVILFTDDSWQTAKTALGKVVYNEDGVDKKAYGLLAEVVVGSLVMSNKMKIVNKDSSIVLDGNGILIKKQDGTETFKATPDGNLIVKAEIAGGTINIGDKFKVDDKGDVRMSGNILIDGHISWGSGSSPTRVLYSPILIDKPVNDSSWNDFPNSNSSGWHKNFASGDIYGTYTYDGGNTWTEPIQIIGLDGRNGVDGENGSDADVTDENVFNALTNNGTMYGCFAGVNNRLYINAAYIRSGTISSDLVLGGEVKAQNIIADGGKIGGWILRDTWLKSDGGESGVYCGLYSGNYKVDNFYTCNKPSLVNPGKYSNGRFYAGASESEKVSDSKFTVLDDGSLYAAAAQITGTLTNLDSSGKNGVKVISNRIEFYDNGTQIDLIGTGGMYNAQRTKTIYGLKCDGALNVSGQLLLGGSIGMSSGNYIYIDGKLVCHGYVKFCHSAGVATIAAEHFYLRFVHGLLVGIYKSKVEGDYLAETYIANGGSSGLHDWGTKMWM